MVNTIRAYMRRIYIKQLLFGSLMINNCSKAQALLNAQAVMTLAVQFGHGDVVTLSVGETAVVLTLVYDSSWFVEERETEWICDRVMNGVKHWSVDDKEVNAFSIFVSWEFNASLK